MIIPSSRHDDLIYEFLRLRDSWPENAVELKGSSLAENRINAVIDLMLRHEVILDARIIDMASHTDDEISSYKEEQARNITANLTPQHAPAIVQYLKDLESSVRGLPSQLFVQAQLSILLLPSVLQIATLYWCQRHPRELSTFRWVLDAKDRETTVMEKTWSDLVLPYMENLNRSEPFAMLEGGDYSHFAPFMTDEQSASPAERRHIDWLAGQRAVERRDRLYEGIRVKEIFKDRTFVGSRETPGLQLADIAVSATTRAMNGSLRPDGWKKLGSLFIRRTTGCAPILHLRRSLVVHSAIAKVKRILEEGARSLLDAKWKAEHGG